MKQKKDVGSQQGQLESKDAHLGFANGRRSSESEKIGTPPKPPNIVDALRNKWEKMGSTLMPPRTSVTAMKNAFVPQALDELVNDAKRKLYTATDRAQNSQLDRRSIPPMVSENTDLNNDERGKKDSDHAMSVSVPIDLQKLTTEQASKSSPGFSSKVSNNKADDSRLTVVREEKEIPKLTSKSSDVAVQTLMTFNCLEESKSHHPQRKCVDHTLDEEALQNLLSTRNDDDKGRDKYKFHNHSRSSKRLIVNDLQNLNEIEDKGLTFVGLLPVMTVHPPNIPYPIDSDDENETVLSSSSRRYARISKR
jgi:hypothetical protein